MRFAWFEQIDGQPVAVNPAEVATLRSVVIPVTVEGVEKAPSVHTVIVLHTGATLTVDGSMAETAAVLEGDGPKRETR